MVQSDSGRVSFVDFVVSSFSQSLAGGSGGVVEPTEKGVGEGGVAPVYANDAKGVLFSHDFEGGVLAIAADVTKAS